MNFFKRNKHMKISRLAIVPKHIAVIMDGNGRWAKQRGLPRTAGHRAGMERAQEAVETCLKFGVKHLTLFAFSTENWRRPLEEVSFLMKLFEEAMQTKVDDMHRLGVKIRFIGLRQGLSPSLLKMIENAEELTVANHAITVNIAINYGGRSEIVSAVREIAESVRTGTLQVEDIHEEVIAGHLFTSGQPDPDLLIKPGREFRISNFLIWQLAYTEFYFSDTLWPDFDREEFIRALHWFGGRERRFGRIEAGVKGE